jgi:hypothetical protein
MTQNIISDEAITAAWGNANFGEDVDKREIISNALLKYACGYVTGHTIECICTELKLIGKTRNLTKSGKQYLYAFYEQKFKVSA